MLNGPSDHPVQLEAPKKSPIHFLVPREKIKCLTPANIIEILLAKHARLVANYPWFYIIGCLILTIGTVIFYFKISPLEGTTVQWVLQSYVFQVGDNGTV